MGWPIRAAAIVCVPCRRQDGHFLPTSELVLASLDGTEQRHPVFQLAALMRSPCTVSELHRRGVEEIVVVVDDLAVSRSWMLPPTATTAADLWPSLRASFTKVLEEGPIPCRVTLWSRLVEGLDYEEEVGRLAALCEENTTSEDHPLQMAFGAEIAKRRRFERETGRGDTEETTRRRAAAQVANYAAQGRLLRTWRLNTYLAWTAEETGLMAAVEPGFADLVLKATYGSLPRNQEEPWGAFPADFSELREELRLYADDLERTPGRVRPELAIALLNALAQLLTPGTQPAAARQVRAFNQVLSGGQVNRLRTERLLEEVLRLPLIPGWAVGQTVKKLFCQLASRYDDDEADAEYTRHMHVIRSLNRRLPANAREHVALALTGSLALAPAGIWHPFFSDIDVMPLFSTPPPEGLVSAIRTSYTSTPRPPWLYLNEGAKQGLAGLTHDPTRGMFVADRLHTLTDVEYGKLSRLVAPMRRVGGSPAVFTTFTDAYRRQRYARSEQPRERAGAD